MSLSKLLCNGSIWEMSTNTQISCAKILELAWRGTCVFIYLMNILEIVSYSVHGVIQYDNVKFLCFTSFHGIM